MKRDLLKIVWNWWKLVKGHNNMKPSWMLSCSSIVPQLLRMPLMFWFTYTSSWTSFWHKMPFVIVKKLLVSLHWFCELLINIATHGINIFGLLSRATVNHYADYLTSESKIANEVWKVVSTIVGFRLVHKVLFFIQRSEVTFFLQKNKRPVPKLIKYMMDIGLGMHHISSLGLVHRVTLHLLFFL